MARAKTAELLQGRLQRVARSADKAHGRPIPTAQRREPDPRSVRKWRPTEDPVARRRRLRAKTVNFTCTLTARAVIMFGLGYFLLHEWEHYGVVDRRGAFILLAMVADYGRVIMKALEPGTK